MGRIQDPTKPAKILEVLKNNKEGMWINQIARELGFYPSSVHYYLNRILVPQGQVKKIKDYKVGQRSVVMVYQYVKDNKDTR